MRSLIFALVVLCASSASAQWGYVPLEYSIPRQMGYGRVDPGYAPYRAYGGYYGRYYGEPIRVYVSRDPLDASYSTVPRLDYHGRYYMPR